MLYTEEEIAENEELLEDIDYDVNGDGTSSNR